MTDSLTISSYDELIATIPHTLGFTGEQRGVHGVRGWPHRPGRPSRLS
jgi:hypothetical protein